MCFDQDYKNLTSVLLFFSRTPDTYCWSGSNPCLSSANALLNGHKVLRDTHTKACACLQTVILTNIIMSNRFKAFTELHKLRSLSAQRPTVPSSNVRSGCAAPSVEPGPGVRLHQVGAPCKCFVVPLTQGVQSLAVQTTRHAARFACLVVLLAMPNLGRFARAVSRGIL